MARPEGSRGGVSQTLIGVFILLILAGITATILHRQLVYVSPRYAQTEVGKSSGTGNAPTANCNSPIAAKPRQAESSPAAPLLFMPPGMAEMTPPESFGPDGLSDKIDGRAELYLSAGFVAMRCQRFADAQDGNQWMETFVYDMGTPDNAYSVFSQQRRPDVKDSDVAAKAYMTQNSLHLAHGRYYVEIVQAAPTPRMAEAAVAFARKFVAGITGGGKKLAELELFPPDNLRAGSISRATEDQFGIEGLDNVYTAIYVVDGKTVTAFLSRRKSSQEADSLAKAYADFFLPFGAKVINTDSPVGGAKTLEIDGVFKCVFTRGSLLAGVHEAPDAASARAVAEKMGRKLTETGD